MHESLLFHLPRSLLVPSLLIGKPSLIWPGQRPFLGVITVTSDEVETLATGLIPGPWPSFFNFDRATDVRPAHCDGGRD